MRCALDEWYSNDQNINPSTLPTHSAHILSTSLFLFLSLSLSLSLSHFYPVWNTCSGEYFSIYHTCLASSKCL